MKRLLVTGADGFTGRHLVSDAIKHGYEVVKLLTDLSNEEAVIQEVQALAPSEVIHLAAISAVSHSDQNAFYQVNLFGSINLLNALTKLPIVPNKVVLASSANVYGSANSQLIDETLCPKPINHYAMSKLAMEHMATPYFERLPIVVTRPFNYTGLGHDNRFVIPKIVEHFINKATEIELGNVEVYREYNDVRMICDVYLKLLELGVPGQIYNVCSGTLHSLQEVLTILRGITGQFMEVKVNRSLVRPNEIYCLGGNPKKLQSCIGMLKSYYLEDTLKWMFEDS